MNGDELVNALLDSVESIKTSLEIARKAGRSDVVAHIDEARYHLKTAIANLGHIVPREAAS